MEPKDLKHEQNLEALQRVEKSLEAFKEGMGKRMDENGQDIKNHNTRIVIMETNLNALVRVSWLLASSCAVIIVAAVLKLIIK